MKILGKNSLSAGVKVGLKVILAIVIILEIALIAFSIITKANIIEEPKNIILYLFMVTAIPAVIVVYNFIKIFIKKVAILKIQNRYFYHSTQRAIRKQYSDSE